MSPQAKHILVVNAVALVAALLCYGSAWYLVNMHKSKVYERVVARATAEGKKAGLDALRETHSMTAEERASLSNFIVPEEGVTDFLNLIERTALEEGLAIDTKAVSEEPLAEPNPLYESLVLTIEVTGTFSDVSFMLAALESLPYQVMVSETEFHRLDIIQDSWAGTFTFAVTKAVKPRS